MRRDELRVRDLVLAALLMGMGLILHAFFPGIFAGMKPDFSLVMLFVVMLVIPDRKIALISGLVTGILTALTTTFPAGQIPNLIDKATTTAAVLALLAITPKKIQLPAIGILGTLVSGTAFLTTALLLTGLPAPFSALFIAVVLPATIVNTIGLFVLYPLVNKLYQVQEKRLPVAVRTTK